MSELKVQVFLSAHSGTFTAMRCPVVTDGNLMIFQTKYRTPMLYVVLRSR